MNNFKIINVVSGKGGTGKTLLTAVLAEILGNESHSVLVVDLDVFVRGLTSLLYYHKKEKMNLSEENEVTVAELFIHKGDIDLAGKNKLSIQRYRSFDVVPSVAQVDEILYFTDLMPDSKLEAREIITKLIELIPDNYDYIFFDSRAGYDELIYASHFLSDITLCVEEEDNISRITSDNLIRQLKEDSSSPIFRIINKSTNSNNDNYGINSLGKIPFDMDVMQSFGKENFWSGISTTLYKASLISSWNNLSNKASLNAIIENHRVSPTLNVKIEKKLQFYSLTDRVIILYGALLSVAGILGPLVRSGQFIEMLSSREGLFNLISFTGAALGVIMMLVVIIRKRK